MGENTATCTVEAPRSKITLVFSPRTIEVSSRESVEKLKQVQMCMSRRTGQGRFLFFPPGNRVAKGPGPAGAPTVGEPGSNHGSSIELLLNDTILNKW